MISLLLMVAAGAQNIFYYSDNYCHTVLGQTTFGSVNAVINYTTPVKSLIYDNPLSIRFQLETQNTGSSGIVTYLSLAQPVVSLNIVMDSIEYVAGQFYNNVLNLWTAEKKLWTVNVKDLPPVSGGYKFIANITYDYNISAIVKCSYGAGFSLTLTCYSPLFSISVSGCSVYNGTINGDDWQSINYY